MVLLCDPVGNRCPPPPQSTKAGLDLKREWGVWRRECQGHPLPENPRLLQVRDRNRAHLWHLGPVRRAGEEEGRNPFLPFPHSPPPRCRVVGFLEVVAQLPLVPPDLGELLL